MARDFKTEEYSCVCVCVCVFGGGRGRVKEYISCTPHSPLSIFKKPEQFSLLTIFDWSW